MKTDVAKFPGIMLVFPDFPGTLNAGNYRHTSQSRETEMYLDPIRQQSALHKSEGHVVR